MRWRPCSHELAPKSKQFRFRLFRETFQPSCDVCDHRISHRYMDALLASTVKPETGRRETLKQAERLRYALRLICTFHVHLIVRKRSVLQFDAGRELTDVHNWQDL